MHEYRYHFDAVNVINLYLQVGTIEIKYWKVFNNQVAVRDKWLRLLWSTCLNKCLTDMLSVILIISVI